MSIKIETKDKRGSPKTPEEIVQENKDLLSAFTAQLPPEKNDKLAALEAKLAQKMKTEEVGEEVPEVISRKEVSINLGIIGVGQAGSRIAEVFHKLGYDAGVINTSAQDLKFINMLPSQKLLLQGSLGGTGKDLDLGREIFVEHETEVASFVSEISTGNDMVYLAISGGGGTGASSVDSIIPLLFDTGLPVGVIYVLPKATEDAQSKKNSIETMARLAKMTTENLISSLVVVDNARIEQIYGGLSQSEFWETANSAIVEPIHLFNTLTSQPSKHTSLDPSDFGRIISEGDCSVYGVVEVEDYMEETALAEAVIDSLDGNMLAEGFDLTQTRTGGVIIAGPEQALDRLPAINIDYCFHMISKQTRGANIYQGIYSVASDQDVIKIYSWFAGLGLPKDRIENLKKESKEQEALSIQKSNVRDANMTLDLEDNKVSNIQEQIHRKIQKKKSGFNKLQRGSRRSIIDKRRGR